MSTLRIVASSLLRNLYNEDNNRCNGCVIVYDFALAFCSNRRVFSPLPNIFLKKVLRFFLDL